MNDLVKRILVAALLYSSGGIAFANPELAVIAHIDVTVDSATAEQLKNLWLGKTRKLPGTRKIKVVDQPANSDLRAEFYAVIVRKTHGQAKAYWAKIIFTGKDYPPKVLPSDAAIIKWVAKTPNSIAYIDSSSVNDSVKVLLEL